MTPPEIKSARTSAGLTQERAAAVVHVARRTWQDWESGKANMPGAAWELFKLKTSN